MELHLDKMLNRYKEAKAGAIKKRKMEIAKEKTIAELNKITKT